MIVVVAAACALAAGACGNRSAGVAERDGGRDAGGDGPGGMGDVAADASGDDGRARDGSGEVSTIGPDSGSVSCAQAGGMCACASGGPAGHQPAPEPLRSSSCPQPPPGSGACAMWCYLPVAGACTDKGAACPAGMACDLDVPFRCFASTASGTCVTRPSSCPSGGEPVCGCDGQTYNNDCLRQRAAVQLDHKGVCVPAPSCGPDRCEAGQSCCNDCAGNRFCEPGACSAVPAPCQPCTGSGGCPSGSYCATTAAGDFRSRCNPMGAGFCAPMPTSCPGGGSPVCGCDGRTYASDCRRRMAGVKLDHAGACP